MLLLMRDQIHAHMDVDGVKIAEDNSLNKIRVSIENGHVFFAMTMAFPRGAEIENIRELTKLLAEKTRFHADKIWLKHFKTHYVPDNNYEVNISKDDNDFLKLLRF